MNASIHTMTLEDRRGQLLLNSMRPVRSTTKCSFATSNVIAFEVCACMRFPFTLPSEQARFFTKD